jgi:hypothetical protein
MSKLLLSTLLTFYSFSCYSQIDLNGYLENHHYPFSVDSGFSKSSAEALKQKLGAYKLILLGEGGSHYLQFYEPLRLNWIKFLNKEFGMTHFFMEFGHSSGLLCNQYLQTGDVSYLPTARFTKNKIFWTSLFSYNQERGKDQQAYSFGVDFERTHSYLKALKLLLPIDKPPITIESSIDLVRKLKDTTKSCDEVISINSSLKSAFNRHQESFKQYLTGGYEDFKQIVMNNGSCADAEKNRNRHMADNFLNYAEKFDDRIYYGQLGMAHTNLTSINTATIINNDVRFKDKVCVVNTYCYNCTTPEETVSNWQLRKIESDILEKLLPFCISDFTLFDFADDNREVKRFRDFGQFLIIAKNQN